MIEQKLLNRLERIKQTSSSRWIARCPSHKDRTPSLSIALTDDGRLLVHCHAGCEVEDVVAAVGLQISDLFPPRAISHYAAARSDCNLSAAEAVLLIQHEAQVIGILAAQIEDDPFAQVDMHRLHDAIGRINETCQRVR